jgi:hypothetical protein
MKVFCTALLSGKFFPTRSAHRRVKGGENLSPPVAWTDVPAGTQSFVLTIFDRHPVAHNWLHWCIINLPASMRELTEGASGVRERMSEGSLEIRNSYGDAGYGGPNPPRHSGPHNYEITVYALSTPSLPLGPLASSEECLDAMKRHVLARASVVGVFEQ